MSKEKSWWFPVYHGGNLSFWRGGHMVLCFPVASRKGAVGRDPRVEKSWRTKRAEEKRGVRKRHAGQLWEAEETGSRQSKSERKKKKERREWVWKFTGMLSLPEQLNLYTLLKSVGFLGRLWWFLPPTPKCAFSSALHPLSLLCLSLEGDHKWQMHGLLLTSKKLHPQLPALADAQRMFDKCLPSNTNLKNGEGVNKGYQL